MAISPEDRQDVAIAASFRKMISSEGWHHFEKILGAIIKSKEAEVFKPYQVARSADPGLTVDGYREIQAENKASLYALRLALDTPKSIIANADDILSRIRPEERHVIEENLS